jgi:putative membrane protein
MARVSKEDVERIAAAVAAAEKAASGEIVCVLARASSHYGHAPLLWAATLALALPGVLLVFTDWPAQHVYLAQIGLFFAAVLLLSIPALRYAIVPRSAKRARAHRAALEQFFARRVSHTQQHNGVLIYVSLAERYARIVADDGIAAKVGQQEWQEAVDRLVAGIRDKRLGDGFVEAIGLCGAILARHFPAGDNNPNELPDRPIVL